MCTILFQDGSIDDFFTFFFSHQRHTRLDSLIVANLPTGYIVLAGKVRSTLHSTEHMQKHCKLCAPKTLTPE